MERIGQGLQPLISMLRQSDNSRTGATTVIEYEGSYDDCKAKEAIIIGWGPSDTNIDSVGNGYYKLTASFPFTSDGLVTNFPEVPSIHELEVNTLQISIYRSDKLRQYLTPEQIGIVQRVVAEYQAGDFHQAYLDGKSNPDSAGWTEPDIARNSLDDRFLDTTPVEGRNINQAIVDGESLFNAVALIGVEDFITYTNVYRRTLTAATPDQVKASYKGAGKIWTTDEIKEAESIPADAFFGLNPNSIWLKSKPQVIATAGQKTQVIYTYTEAQTAVGLIYDAYQEAVDKMIYMPDGYEPGIEED